jgi:hypothetical protein
MNIAQIEEEIKALIAGLASADFTQETSSMNCY